MRSLLLILLAGACSDPDPEPVSPLFPTSYATSYTEVRNCRSSADHELNKIRVLADATALEPYTLRASPFPVGATLLKEEYDFGDVTCEGPVVQWTVMQRIDGVVNGGWHWQRVSAEGGPTVELEDGPRCISCHSNCVEPDGYLGTCTEAP